jgi:hypothetical protein
MREPNARWRVTEMERSAVKAEMRALLIGCARERRTITYGELCACLATVTLHPHTFVFTRLLRETCAEAADAGEGPLCALVVAKATGMPSGGYFAREISDVNRPDGLEALWRAELDEVFARWANG